MRHLTWRMTLSGELTRETDAFQLSVREIGGLTRFLVFRSPANGGASSRGLLGSGTSANARAAMLSAERLAKSFEAIAPEPTISLGPDLPQPSLRPRSRHTSELMR
jgi:hypothetical protein